MTGRVPLFQEALRDDPFWMVVGCLLVNRGSWRPTGSAVHAMLRLAHPTPRDLASADPDDDEEIVRPTGFGRQRAAYLVALAADWARSPPVMADDVLALTGCGKYAADSFAIFVEGRRDVAPTDRRLLEHLTHEGCDPCPA